MEKLSEQADQDCRHCEGTGIMGTQNGADDFNVDVCNCVLKNENRKGVIK